MPSYYPEKPFEGSHDELQRARELTQSITARQAGGYDEIRAGEVEQDVAADGNFGGPLSTVPAAPENQSEDEAIEEGRDQSSASNKVLTERERSELRTRPAVRAVMQHMMQSKDIESCYAGKTLRNVLETPESNQQRRQAQKQGGTPAHQQNNLKNRE